MTPYDPTQTKATLSEIYVDANKVAKIQWSKAATIAAGATQATLANSDRTNGQNVTPIVPSGLLIRYLSDLQRGQVHLRSGGRLRGCENRHPAQRRRLIPAPRQSDCVSIRRRPRGAQPQCGVAGELGRHQL